MNFNYLHCHVQFTEYQNELRCKMIFFFLQICSNDFDLNAAQWPSDYTGQFNHSTFSISIYHHYNQSCSGQSHASDCISLTSLTNCALYLKYLLLEPLMFYRYRSLASALHCRQVSHENPENVSFFFLASRFFLSQVVLSEQFFCFYYLNNGFSAVV